jgi:hypothetical protein
MPKMLGWLILWLMVVACTPQVTNTPVPTQTLIPPTVTPTSTPIQPTITPQDLPRAQEFNLTPSPTPLRPLLVSSDEFDPEVIRNTRLDLAENLGLNLEQIQLVEVLNRLYYAPTCSLGGLALPATFASGYEVAWLAESDVYIYLTWGDELIWCDVTQLRGKYLTAVDPIAAELSALAVRRIQQQSDTPDAVDLIDVTALQWTDSSLGCPQEGQDYSTALIDGYRIIISDGETSYLFHTDSVQLVSCDFDNATS